MRLKGPDGPAPFAGWHLRLPVLVPVVEAIAHEKVRFAATVLSEFALARDERVVHPVG